MLTEIFSIIIRSVVTIFILFIVTKILGKKQVSQLTIYDYVIGITIGSIAADTITSLDEHVINGISSLITCGLLGYSLSYFALKSSKINNILNGQPIVLMYKGQFIYENLNKTKITISKFIEESRLKGYYDISLINYAILETNGQISFLPKEEYQNCTTKDFKSDIKNKTTKQTMCLPIIIDGIVDEETLKQCKKDSRWLKNELHKLEINKEDEVLLATIDEKEKIIIYK